MHSCALMIALLIHRVLVQERLARGNTRNATTMHHRGTFGDARACRFLMNGERSTTELSCRNSDKPSNDEIIASK